MSSIIMLYVIDEVLMIMLPNVLRSVKIFFSISFLVIFLMSCFNTINPSAVQNVPPKSMYSTILLALMLY